MFDCGCTGNPGAQSDYDSIGIGGRLKRRTANALAVNAYIGLLQISAHGEAAGMIQQTDINAAPGSGNSLLFSLHFFAAHFNGCVYGFLKPRCGVEPILINLLFARIVQPKHMYVDMSIFAEIMSGIV
jgi:hypothetical protein